MSILTENTRLTTTELIAMILKIIKEAKDSIESEKKLFHFFKNLGCELLQSALEILDKELYEKVYKKCGYKVERIDERTVYCLFGELTYKRRLLKKEGAKSIYPLDHKMGFEARKHYSLGTMALIVKAMAKTTARNASEMIQDLAHITVSHQTVVSIKNCVGRRIRDYEEKKADEAPEAKETVESGIIAIEGDGIVMKGKEGGKKEELHRIQIYTGIKKNGNRTELTGSHYFEGLDRKALVRRVTHFIQNHYDLANLTVLSNGDGGAGYQFSDFDDMVAGCKIHHHFRDLYHVNKKIRTRLSFCPREFVDTMVRDLFDVIHNMRPWLDTALSLAKTGKDIEQVSKLEAYIERNKAYIPTLKQRGIKTNIHLGTAETNHRYYSYRLKRQGRVWSHSGLDYMAAVLTALKTGELDEALMYRERGKSYKQKDRAMNTAARGALKAVYSTLSASQKRRAKSYRLGCVDGRIACYGASTAPMAQFAKAIQNY